MKMNRNHRTLSIMGIFSFASVLVFGVRTESVAVATPPDSSGYLYSRFTPAVIRSDSLHAITLQAVTTGDEIQQVTMDWMFTNKVVWLPMHDDGTHGDQSAGDGIYTLNNLVRKSDFYAGYYEGHHRHTGTHVKIRKSDGKEYQYVIDFGMVDAQTIRPVKDFGDGCYATKTAFFVVDSQAEIFPGYPLTPIDCGRTTFPKAYQKLYSHFADVFDFIIVMPANTLYQPDTYQQRVPYCIMTKNDIQHIGVPIFDDTAQYFSAGKLHSVIYHSYGYGAILDHEVGHTWGMRLGATLGLLQHAGTPGDLYGHWLAETDINGQMSYFVDGQTIVDNGDGTWRLLPQNPIYSPYSPLELYAMGLLPANAVPPVHILTNPNYTNPDRITADSVRTVTIEDIMAAEGGERIPAFPNTQNNFKAAFVFISDRPFTDAEYAYFSLIAEYFASDHPGYGYLTPFETATANRATLDVALPGMEYLSVERTGEVPHKPGRISLQQNYPNPFNAATTIEFTLTQKSEVTLKIYDLLGREIAVLIREDRDAGKHTARWDAGALPDGLYVYRLQAAGLSACKKLILIK